MSIVGQKMLFTAAMVAVVVCYVLYAAVDRAFLLGLPAIAIAFLVTMAWAA